VGNLGPILAAVAFGIASLAFVWFSVQDRMAGGERLARRLMGSTRRAVGSYATAKLDRLVAEDGALRSFEKFLTPDNEERTTRIRTKLTLAGYRSPAAVRVYFATKWSIAIGGFVVAALLFVATFTPERPAYTLVAMLMVILLSFFAVDMWIQRKIAYRRLAVERAFPDALDLLLVCLEAGHGLDQAIARVATEIDMSSPVLSTEMKLAVAQLRAGRDREKVLSDFAWRTGVSDIAAFTTVLRQADQFGVSIAETLRIYSAEMRNKRYMRAEERANLMPVKLALGAVMFTVPPTIIVLIGPSIVLIVREMAKAASG
jgi:tight adherence protein C